MAEVKFSLTPPDFDLLRRAIELYVVHEYHIASNHDGISNDLSPAKRQEARAESLMASDLLKKLNG